MRNSRGFLLAEETLKIIIAVICILFLAYFLISLYLKNSADEDLEMAKASLEHLVNEINAGNPTVEIYNPEGWVISSWGLGGFPLPKSCDNLGWKNCICICDEYFYTIKVEGLATDCDSNGFCLENAFEVKGDRAIIGKAILENSIKIIPPLILKISGGKITK